MVEHPTRSRRVVCSNPISDFFISDFFRVYVSPRIYIILLCGLKKVADKKKKSWIEKKSRIKKSQIEKRSRIKIKSRIKEKSRIKKVADKKKKSRIKKSQIKKGRRLMSVPGHRSFRREQKFAWIYYNNYIIRFQCMIVDWNCVLVNHKYHVIEFSSSWSNS